METAFALEPGFGAREVQTREDLARYLSRSLPGDYRLVVDDEVRSTATYVKSYLIEAHPDEQASIPTRLAAVFPEVVPLRDRSLLRAADAMGAHYFVDIGHPRYQLLHSIDKSEKTDRAFLALTEGEVAGFDHAWLPGSLLGRSHRGRLTGFKFRYQTAVGGAVALDPEVGDSETGELGPEQRGGSRFNMTVAEDVSAERELARLLRLPVFQGRKALEQVQFRAVNEDAPGEFIVNGVYSYGKVVGSGSSVGGHFLTIDGLLSEYAAVIRRIEDEFAIGWVAARGGHVLKGEPFVVRFPEDVRVVDLGAFVESVFRSSRPFRLFGIPHSAGEGRIDVAAVDLHTGSPLSFEITPEWMRVYLPRGSCGNIIARLYTNLQHALSSEVRVTVGDDLDVFAAAQ
jgi:hypothetical protein